MNQSTASTKHLQKRKIKRRIKRLLYLPWIIMLLGIIILSCVVIVHNMFHPSTVTSSTASSQESVAASDCPDITLEEVTEEHTQIDVNDWKLVLVNATHPLASQEPPSLTELKNGQSIDSRCYQELQKMIDDCRSAGYEPYICSSYRTMNKQKKLFRQQTQEYLNQGYSTREAQELAAESVAIPGTSEHQLGLAVDIVDYNHPQLDQTQEDTQVQKWLMENSWRYGFILRYPPEKSDITGIIYEPWHYRYVGKAAAKEIYQQNITLEEYLSLA